MLLDLRTLSHVGEETIFKKAVKLLLAKYVQFSVQYYYYKYEWDTMVVDDDDGDDDDVDSVQPIEEKGTDEPDAAPVIFTASAYLADRSDGSSVSSSKDLSEEQVQTEESLQADNATDARKCCRKHLKHWCQYPINWKAVYTDSDFPEQPTSVRPLEDILHLAGYGCIVVHRKEFGFLQLIASYCKGQIGALNAESYPERANSIGKLIMTNDSTLIGDDLLDKLVTLRVNSGFSMEHIRAHYLYHIKSE